MRPTRWLLVGALLCFSGAAAAQEESGPALKGESSSIKPVGERKLGKKKRPTVSKKKADKEKKERSKQISWQIPAKLRAALEKKIDDRITRNIREAKKLRREALGLLRKFIKESPESAPSMPEALMRLGELEWEDARDQFLVDFNKWEDAPASKRGEPP
ncbi:MAG: hypothetical protein KC766_15115 [Myxococcales bacterium]|nr:hypothetical protein [Myxococcales bacterium]